MTPTPAAFQANTALVVLRVATEASSVVLMIDPSLGVQIERRMGADGVRSDLLG
jgi:hypothetical protein